MLQLKDANIGTKMKRALKKAAENLSLEHGKKRSSCLQQTIWVEENKIPILRKT